jgi:hypothetical protein
MADYLFGTAPGLVAGAPGAVATYPSVNLAANSVTIGPGGLNLNGFHILDPGYALSAVVSEDYTTTSTPTTIQLTPDIAQPPTANSDINSGVWTTSGPAGAYQVSGVLKFFAPSLDSQAQVQVFQGGVGQLTFFTQTILAGHYVAFPFQVIVEVAVGQTIVIQVAAEPAVTLQDGGSVSFVQL